MVNENEVTGSSPPAGTRVFEALHAHVGRLGAKLGLSVDDENKIDAPVAWPGFLVTNDLVNLYFGWLKLVSEHAQNLTDDEYAEFRALVTTCLDDLLESYQDPEASGPLFHSLPRPLLEAQTHALREAFGRPLRA